ncbi:MAG: hypothetical protein IR162_19640 [Rhodococcus sp.]|nr:hypothetical protein [Rhodococcus sp. (in: high G+C Gram-positive bacteria)]
MYTRADCPRYGDLAGASCATAPDTGAPPISSLDREPPIVSTVPVGGNVGPVGGEQEKDLLGKILGGDASAAAELLLGPVARGAVVSIIPDADGAPR